MTNFEKIKQMSVEDMVDFITGSTNGCEYGCSYCSYYKDSDCISDGYIHNYIKGCRKWLESEATEVKEKEDAEIH